MKYCIVDIETTGGASRDHKITEIAAIKFDGEKIIDTFQTLIHPERSIPWNITQLTGITNEMVEDKPKFFQIAKDLLLFLENTVFVAHNVYFDYNFIKKEFADLGFQFKMPQLCTVKLGRKILPGHKSYSLKNICRDLSIDLTGHHRAMCDAKATCELFVIYMAKNPKLIEEQIHQHSNQLCLPPQLPENFLEQFPNQTGIYYFYNQKGEIIYIGKSVHIKKRLQSHFRPKMKTKDLQLAQSVFDIKYRLTGNDLLAQLLEASEIKKHRPQFNKSMNRVRFPYQVFLELDENGYLDLGVSQQHPNSKYQFPSRKKAKLKIERLYQQAFEDFGPHGIQEIKDLMTAEEFNQKLKSVIEDNPLPYENFRIIERGIKAGEKCVIQFKNYTLSDVSLADESLDLHVDPDSYYIVNKYLRNNQIELEIFP